MTVAQAFVMVWLLILSGPYGDTIHPLHFKNLYACGLAAIEMSHEHPEIESRCEPVSRPIILPTRLPLGVPQADA